METSFNNTPEENSGVGGYDITAELEKMKNEGGGYNPNQKKPVKQGSGGFGGKLNGFIPDDKKKILTYLGIGGVVIVLILLSFFLLSHNKQVAKNNSTQSQVQTQNNDSRALFKASIQTAVNAQEAKGNISKKWRAATVEYSKTQDLNVFKETLNQVNEERTSYIEKIKSDDNELNNLVINALNNQREYLNKAYNVDNSADAISIYNEWNSGDKQNSDGGPTIEY